MNTTAKQLLKDAYNILTKPEVHAAAERIEDPYDKTASEVISQLETYLVMACEGVEAIAKERTGQFVKHSYTLAHDVKHNAGGVLKQAVIGILSNDMNAFPSEWPDRERRKMLFKGELEQLAIAGSMLAAEYSRVKFVTETAEDHE